MPKIPKLSELTDVKKLKELGSSIASQAKVGDVFDKVKAGVDNLTGSKTESEDSEVGEAKNPIEEQLSSLAKLLNQSIAAHKAQGEAISRMGKSLKKLHSMIQAQQQAQQQSNATENDEDSEDESPEPSSEKEE